MFESDDDRRKKAAERSGKQLCTACGGTGTYGVRDLFGSTSKCSACNGNGYK